MLIIIACMLLLFITHIYIFFIIIECVHVGIEVILVDLIGPTSG